MLEKIKLAKYVTDHKTELDEVMQKFFEHWNAVGQLNSNEQTSNKMQVTWLISMIRIMLNTSGMPKPTQKDVLNRLLKSL
jgi:hypothetical protein